MPDDDTLRIRDYREGTEGRAPCPRCGALIARSATGCHECGVHFRGRASEFIPEKDIPNRVRNMFRFVAGLILALIFLAIIAGLISVLVATG